MWPLKKLAAEKKKWSVRKIKKGYFGERHLSGEPVYERGKLLPDTGKGILGEAFLFFLFWQAGNGKKILSLGEVSDIMIQGR